MSCCTQTKTGRSAKATWMGVRWIGVPWPLRVVEWAGTGFTRWPQHPGCGCILKLKVLWEGVRLAWRNMRQV